MLGFAPMLKSTGNIESLLLRLERHFERTAGGTWLVHLGPGQPPAALRLGDPVLIVQVTIGPAPIGEGSGARLLRRLLELNATDLAHTAYAIAEQEIVLVAARELSSLDPNELEAILSEIEMALGSHVAVLKQLSESH
jgi:Tir chaperone protein (CesT) family